MKKTITKLVLRREAIKTLIDGDLDRAVGGHGGPCAGTYENSGCLQIPVAFEKK